MTRLRCWVEISRGQLAANYASLCRAVGPGVQVMAVVKADAYRHGATEVSRTLVAEGCQWLAVSSVEEGVALRRANIDARILVMGGVLPWEHDTVRECELTPALHDLADIRTLGRTPYHLKVDSGMGRLGTRATPAAIVEAVRAGGPERLEGLMTHFASSADFSSPQTDLQIEAFQQVREALAAAGIEPPYTHLSSTNPIVLPRHQTWRNLVRPGLALYGYWSPGREGPRPTLDVGPVLTWKASVVLIKDIPRGSPIGYGALYWAQRDMRIAVVGIGYADGLPHRLSNKGRLIAGGRFVRIVGAVSMDLTTIDVTNVPDLKVGDAVTVVGSDSEVSQDARYVARQAGTMTYSLLCGISARVVRVYR